MSCSYQSTGHGVVGPYADTGRVTDEERPRRRLRDDVGDGAGPGPQSGPVGAVAQARAGEKAGDAGWRSETGLAAKNPTF